MSYSCARHHLLQEKKNLEVKKIIIIHKIDDMKFEKYVVELESCNFKEEDIKPSKCTTQNTLEFGWLKCIIQNPSTLSNSLCKMCKIIEWKRLLDLGNRKCCICCRSWDDRDL